MKSRYYMLALVALLCLVFILTFRATRDPETAAPGPLAPAATGNQARVTEKNNVAVRLATPPVAKRATPEKTGVVQAKTALPEKPLPEAGALAEFDRWLSSYLAAGHSERRDLTARGIKLAVARRLEMARLMQKDPAAALGNALSLYEYEQLPDELQGQVEQPFTGRVNVVIMPDETASGTGPTAYLETRQEEHRVRKLFLFGKRQNITSKNGIGAQGILLDDLAVVHDRALQIVSGAEDLAWATENLPPANQDVTKDFLTGQPIAGAPVVAIAGGRTFYFAGLQNVQLLNSRLAEMEMRIGPQQGSQVLFTDVMAGGAGENSLPAVLSQETPVAANAWTETKKTVFMIRVDFSDKPGESVAKATLQDRLNGPVSTRITEYSYGKTWIEGDVSDMVVTVPQGSSSYLPDKYFDLLYDAKAAFTALGTGIELADYDIVGIHFAEIGYPWGGLASIGAGNIWIQNSLSTSLMAHEFGHNYGLFHASFWNTNGASVVGAGASQEYGDIFDLMGSGGIEGHFHMQGKSRLNWLAAGQWEDIVGNGSYSYRVYRFDHQDASALNRQALRIYKSTGEYYWLGYRRQFPENKWLQNGAYLIWQNSPSKSWLIDTTPGSADDKDDAGIVIGRTYSDTDAGVHITPMARGGTAPDEWLEVRVNVGDFAANHAPAVSIAGPASPRVRTSLQFTAVASDADGDELAYLWDFGDGIQHESSASISHSWVVGGTYTVNVTVSDMKGGVATDQVVVTVGDPLGNWQARTSNTEFDLFDIASDGSRLLAVGEREVLVSNDGIAWSSLGRVGTNVYLYAVIHDGSQWVGVGMDWTGSWSGAIYTSADGTSWTNRYIGGPVLRDIVYSGAAHVAVGDDGTILRSTDAINWTAQSSGKTTPIRGVAYGNSVFTAVGSQFTGGSVLVLTSPDGMNWTDHSSGAGLAGWQGFVDIEFLKNKFLASGWYSKIRYSTDNGATFLTRRSSTEDIAAFAHGNGVYFAAGLDKENSNNDIDLVSMDGINWFALSTPALADRNEALFFNNTFITVGDNGAIRQSDPIPRPLGTMGDVNNDGSVDLADAIITLQILANITVPSNAALDADVSGDARIGFAEAIYVLQTAAGLAPK